MYSFFDIVLVGAILLL